MALFQIMIETDETFFGEHLTEGAEIFQSYESAKKYAEKHYCDKKWFVEQVQ